MAYHSIEDPAKLRRVLEAVLLLEADLDLSSLLRHIIDEARSMTNARYGALGVLDEDGTALAEIHHRRSGAGGGEGNRRPSGRTGGTGAVDLRSDGSAVDSAGVPPRELWISSKSPSNDLVPGSANQGAGQRFTEICTSRTRSAGPSSPATMRH